MFGPRFYILSIGILLLTAIGVSAVPETVRLSNAIWTVDIVTHSLAVEARPIEAETVVPISVGQTGLGDIAEFSQEDNMAMNKRQTGCSGNRNCVWVLNTEAFWQTHLYNPKDSEI